MFVLTGLARYVPVTVARKGHPRSRAATGNRPRTGRVADNLAEHANPDAPSMLVNEEDEARCSCWRLGQD
jgi:hypothetical protein